LVELGESRCRPEVLELSTFMKHERTRMNVIIVAEDLIKEYEKPGQGCFIFVAQVVC
jgi:hypothetical protein